MARRNYLTIRLLILLNLSEKTKSVNELASDAHINWRTTAKHLAYLESKGFVEKHYFAEHLSIYRITKLGFDVLTQAPLQEVLA